jgi:hypothetical protein
METVTKQIERVTKKSMHPVQRSRHIHVPSKARARKHIARLFLATITRANAQSCAGLSSLLGITHPARSSTTESLSKYPSGTLLYLKEASDLAGVQRFVEPRGEPRFSRYVKQIQ